MMTKVSWKTVGQVAKGAFEMFCTVMVAGVLVGKSCGSKRVVTYNDAVKAVMSSSLWNADKTTIVGMLKPCAKPELYEAVVEVIDSSLWSEQKVELITKMCMQTEEESF